MDAVFDSVSVATTFRATLEKAGVIFCPISEAVREHPELVRQYLGTVVPVARQLLRGAELAPCSPTAASCYMPKGVRCPMELSTYFRINARNTGQFERTLIIAEEGSYVSYLEGCTAPQRDENQLHAAVVELVAHRRCADQILDGAELVSGRRGRSRRHLQFRHQARRLPRCAVSKISWTQVETGSAITWKYPSCVLEGDDSVGEFYSVAVTNNRQQADTGTKMIHIGRDTQQHDRLQGDQRRAVEQHVSRPGADPAEGAGRAQLTRSATAC